MRIFFFAFLLLSTAPALSQEGGAWTVRRLEWTDTDEQMFSDFVQRLGRSKCANVNDCIRDEANLYAGTDPERVRFYSDCADFPYFLRAYFAWKNELPFGYVSQVGSYDEAERKKNPPVLQPGEKLKPIDLRYSDLGNYPVARRSLVPTKRSVDFFAEMTRLQNMVLSGTLRVGPDYNGKVVSDFYSPEIKIGSIRPGTTIYDPNGHVAVVYDVLPDGRILYFDAHPDNSVTRGQFSAKFARSKPAQGAGFKNFRPVRLVGAKTSSRGTEYVGGTLVFAQDEEIADVSTVQYFGTHPDPQNWRKGLFILRGKTLDFHEYVRRALATEKINPVNELLGALQELCDDLGERVDSVDIALEKGIFRAPHPATLPSNLFGSDGDWESYSTPGRDTRLRATFLELKKNVQERYDEWLRDDQSDMQYNGTDLKRDFLRAFHQVNMECRVTYKNSAKKPVQLGFELSVRRLFRLSFDPYHCPELRWGASHPEELKSCADDAGKRRWYNAQQNIRNSLARDWSAPAPLTVEMLESGRFGATAAPEVDLRKFIESLPPKGSRE